MPWYGWVAIGVSGAVLVGVVVTYVTADRYLRDVMEGR